MQPTRRTVIHRSSLLATGLLGTTRTVTADGRESTATGHLEGTVTHFGQPVEDALLRVDEKTSTGTDEDGDFSQELQPGTYTSSVTADGYAPVTREVDVVADSRTTMDVSLDQAWGPDTGQLDVAVTETGGGDTIPCEITLFGDETNTLFAPLGAVPDGENWESPFRVSEGWWEVRASNIDGYSDGYKKVYVEPGETEFAWVQLTEGDEEISDTGRIEGTVTDERGNRIDDATVFVDGEQLAVTETGAFEVDLEHGRHQIETRAAGYESIAEVTLVKFGRTTELTIALESQ
ncbi:carboxypeptidase regulatory-like domain-containing protein [Natronorubrum sp. DTA28]|uniref:carboxypeptidase regulatory-like domain-containing protein n=1 Tax=Natronorubrum sp. DTA28 TaxID=3447019 RepID=UPI003F844B6C